MGLYWKFNLYMILFYLWFGGRRGRDRMVVEVTTTCAISAYCQLILWVRISIRARCTTLCDEVCQWLATCQWFSPSTPFSSTNKTYCHHITEILLKVALNTISSSPSYVGTLLKVLYVQDSLLFMIWFKWGFTVLV